MIGEIFLQPHIYLHCRQGFRMACILASATLNTYQFPPQTSIGTKTNCFQLHFRPFVLSAASHFLCTPQDWSKIAKSLNMHLTSLAQFFTTNLGKHLERIFYITYGKRTASVNHPAQFIRSHLTIQKNAGMQTFLFRIVGLTGILIPIVKYSH